MGCSYSTINFELDKMNSMEQVLFEQVPVLVVCPKCDDTVLVDNLKTLDETMHKMWQIFKEFGHQFGSQEVVNDAIATAGIMNQKDRILKLFMENGYITAVCRTCLTDTQQQLMIDTGYAIIRRGNLLIDANFYVKEKKMLEEKISEYGLDVRSFWT